MRRMFPIIIFGMVLVLTGCLDDSQRENQFLVRVNNYKINSGDIDKLFKFEVEADMNFHTANTTKADFVKNLVQTQLLIQEAKKRKLDQREIFRQTIQLYWESTLIRDLLAGKEEELRKTVHVSQEEVEEYYKNNKATFQKQSFDRVRPDLLKLLEDQAVTAGLERWIKDLENAADIEIKDPELALKIQRNSN